MKNILIYIILLSFIRIIKIRFRKNVNVNNKTLTYVVYWYLLPLQCPLPSYVKHKDKYLPFSVAFSRKNVLI